jgi:hypothetical protein
MADTISLSTDSTATRKNSAILADELQSKIRKLVDDFAHGAINRTQFHELYDRYHRQLTRIIELTETPASLPVMTSEEREKTFDIKKRLTARVIGVSIYGNQSGLPIETLGDFAIDPALLVPMLSSYRAATREIFSAGMRSTAMDNNQWLCFVPGNFTTLLALFSVEPSVMQLASVEAMHRDFENANKVALERGDFDPMALAYPFLTFVRKAHHLHRRTGVQAVSGQSEEDGK